MIEPTTAACNCNTRRCPICRGDSPSRVVYPTTTAAPLCEVHGTPMTLTPYYQRHTGARVDLETCEACDEREERDARA